MDKSVYNLTNAIILQPCKDYRTALKWDDRATIREIERFFRSEWYKMLTTIDGEFLIDKLRKEYKNENH